MKLFRSFGLALASVAIIASGSALADYTFKDAAGTTQTASAVTDGSQATIGAKADTAWTSGAGSVISVLKAAVGFLSTIATNSGAGTNTTGSTVPASAVYFGANSAGNITGVIQGDTSVAIAISTATTTQLVAINGTKKTYITALNVVAAGTGNIQFVYGTGVNCATGTTNLSGNYNLTAQAGLSLGGGLGPVLVAPAGQAVCATTSAAVGMAGSIAETQF